MSTSTLRKRLPLLAATTAAIAVAAVAQTAPGATGRRPLPRTPNLMSGLNAALFGFEHDTAAGAPNRKGPYFWEAGKWTSAYGQYVETVAAREAGKAPRTGLPAGSTWVNLGPTHADFLTNGVTLNVTDSGRLTSIVVDPVHPSTIYVTAASGGIWKTTNGGASWSAIGDKLPSLSIGTLEMDPTDPQTLYLGLGDAFDATGVGLLKSTDGGAHWTNPVFLGGSTIINDITVSKTNHNLVMAATNQGLFRSTNAGSSFTEVSLATGGADAHPFVWSVVNTSGNNFVASMESSFSNLSGPTDGQIWRSTDAGAGWTRSSGFAAAAPLGRTTLTASPSDPSVMYAMSAISNYFGADDLAGLFRSTDGGASWTALPTAKAQYVNHNAESPTVVTLLNGQGWYNQMLVVDPKSPSTFYIGGALLTAKVSNALGSPSYTQMSNWLAQFGLPYVHADAHAATFATDGSFYIGSDGGIFKSTDSGGSWTDELNNGLTTHQVYNIGSSAAAPQEVLGGLQDNGTRLRKGSTSTFNEVLGGDGFGVDINRTDGTKMLGSIYYDDILKSTDSGKTWANAWTGIREANNAKTAPFNTHIVEWEGDKTGNTLLAHTNGRVYVSTDYAGHWASIGTAGLPANLIIRNIGVAPSDLNTVGIAGNGGRVFVTHNGGASWTQAAAVPNNALSMQSVAFDPGDPSIVYLSSVAPDSSASHVWKSTDGGASFAAIDTGSSGLPFGIPVNVVKVDPLHPATVYAGTHLGLYVSTNAGATWARFGTGLPLVSVTDVYLSPTEDMMRLATYGRGFWELR